MSGAGFTTANRLGLTHSGVLRQTADAAIFVLDMGDPGRITVSTANQALGREAAAMFGGGAAA